MENQQYNLQPSSSDDKSYTYIRQNNFFDKYKKPIIAFGVIVAVIVLFVVGSVINERRQTAQYIQTIGYDIDTLGKSYNRIVEYEHPKGVTYYTLFNDLADLNNANDKIKDNIAKSVPPNERSTKIKNSLLTYTDSLNEMSKAQAQYYYAEMTTPYNKTLLNTKANKYIEKKNIVIDNCEIFNKLK